MQESVTATAGSSAKLYPDVGSASPTLFLFPPPDGLHLRAVVGPAILLEHTTVDALRASTMVTVAYLYSILCQVGGILSLPPCCRTGQVVELTVAVAPSYCQTKSYVAT